MSRTETMNGHAIRHITDKPHSRAAVLGICFAIALVIVTICSKSSFLYPFNDWVDANCFFTVGKSMQSGLIPYRDLAEQKGPLVYFLYALASVISYDTFLGVYLLEILSCAAFLYFGYKIIGLYCEKHVVYYLPFLAVAVYTSRAFYHGGSVEELCFPFMTVPLYWFLKAAKQGTCLTDRESFLTGVLSACVFWMKYTLTGMFAGWFIVFACHMIIKKNAKQLGKTVLLIIAGVAAGSVPYILFFGLNHAIPDLIRGYFTDSLSGYAKADAGSGILGLAKALYGGLINLVENSPAVLVLMVAGCVYFAFRRRFTELLCVAAMIIAAFVFSYISGRTYVYYSLAFAPFACLGFVPVCSFIARKCKKRVFAGVLCLVYALLAAAAVYLTPNRYLMLADKNDLPQYQFARTIEKTPGATLLNYGFLDGGFYTTAGIVPNCRAFCKLNIAMDELKQLQDDHVREGRSDYVVTRDQELADSDPDGLYTLADESEYFLEGKTRKYYLYSRK